MKFPKHKAGMFISHNEHLGYYQNIEEAICEVDEKDWVNEEEKRRALETGNIWRLQWYPETPVGFYTIVASTLEACLEGASDRAGD